MLSLFYVSTARLGGDPAREVDAIVDVAVMRNLTSRVTGALMFTGTHFAQVLEGPEDAVRTIMASIERDPRHEDVRVLRSADEDVRRFPNWGMALVDTVAGSDALVARAREDADHAEALIALMKQGASPLF